MDSERHNIPWRVPCSLDLTECKQDEITYITPSTHWASVIDPGDMVELVSPLTFQPLETYVAVYVKKILLWMISHDELRGFPCADNLGNLITWLASKYGIVIGEYTVVVIMQLKKPDSLSKAYEIFLKPNERNCLEH